MMKQFYGFFFPLTKEKFKAIKTKEDTNEVLEFMVMANGSGETRTSTNQTTDRTCTDVERILHNESYRKPFQVKYYKF